MLSKHHRDSPPLAKASRWNLSKFVVIKHLRWEPLNVQPSCCLDVVVYMLWRLCGYAMAVLGHADMKFFSYGSSRPCRYDFFSNGSSRPCRYEIFFLWQFSAMPIWFFFKWQFSAMPTWNFFPMAVLGHADMNFFFKWQFSAMPMIFFQMAVLGHADMIFFQMAVLGHADMIFFRKYKKNLYKKMFIITIF